MNLISAFAKFRFRWVESSVSRETHAFIYRHIAEQLMLFRLTPCVRYRPLTLTRLIFERPTFGCVRSSVARGSWGRTPRQEQGLEQRPAEPGGTARNVLSSRRSGTREPTVTLPSRYRLWQTRKATQDLLYLWSFNQDKFYYFIYLFCSWK